MRGGEHSTRDHKAADGAQETGIATMTAEEWRSRAAAARKEPREEEIGRQLRELGLIDWQAPSPYAAFAILMGVTDDTVRKWIETDKPPRYARAYVQLALVLKAAQKFVPSPVSPKAEKPIRVVTPSLDKKLTHVVDMNPNVQQESSQLLPKMPLPEHLQRR